MKATTVEVPVAGCPWRVSALAELGVQVQVVAHLPLPDGVLAEDLLLEGREWPRAVAAMREGAQAREVVVLESGLRHARVRAVGVACPLSSAIAASGQAPVLPWKVEGDVERLMILAQDPAPFLEAAERAGLPPRVARVGSFEPRALLTPRQEQVLDAALAAGFWDAPQRTSLTDLAERLDVSPASLKHTLRSIERRVLLARSGRWCWFEPLLDAEDGAPAPRLVAARFANKGRRGRRLGP